MLYYTTEVNIAAVKEEQTYIGVRLVSDWLKGVKYPYAIGNRYLNRYC